MHTGTARKVINKIFLYLFATIFMLIFVYPLYFVVISSTKTSKDIFANPFTPSFEFHFENFTKAFSYGIGRQFINSMVLSIGAVVVTSVLSSMIAFALSRLRFKGRQGMRVYFVMGMMVPIQSIIVILAYVTNMLNLRDNYVLLILLYSAFNMPLSIFIVTSQMNSLPTALEEAAVMDGCNIYQVLLLT